MNDPDPISPDVHRLIQLFSALPEVKFPDVDAPMLHELVAQVKERHQAVAAAEAQLEAARRALDEEQEALLRKAHRLYAWLTVMAEADEPLRAKLADLVLPRLRKAAPTTTGDGLTLAEAPKKRGRPRKVAPASEALFEDAQA
ncbi:MAG: hypothetical protein IAE78_10115 [Myxococcus sp.]|nr:hypothetical protein [Myxococcus sp.]